MNKAYSRINWQNAPSEATALNETNLNKMDSAIDTIDDRVVAHDTRLDNDEYAISQAQGDITTLEGTVSTQGTAITALQSGKVDKSNGAGLSTLFNIEAQSRTNTGTIIGALLLDKYGQHTTEIKLRNGIEVDSALSDSSTNPVQNKAIKMVLDEKVDKEAGKGLSSLSGLGVTTSAITGDTIADILAIDQNGNEYHNYIKNGVEVDSALSSESENPVQNKAVTTELENKADADGNYEDMAVGQLLSNTFEEDKAPYNFRTAGGTLEIGDREYDTLVGGTVAFNQLFDFTENSTRWKNNGSITRTWNNGVLTLSNGVSAAAYSYQEINEITNHCYLYIATGKTTQGEDVTSLGSLSIYKSGATTDITKLFETTKTTVSGIWKAQSNFTNNMQLRPNNTANTLEVYNVLFVDLTQMFGSTIADYIYSLEQATAGSGVAYFKSLFPKDYYDYNAGQLMSVKALSHKMVGFNQWDEEWEVGFINNTDGQNVANSEHIRSKNYNKCFPNTQYCCTKPAGVWFGIYWYDNNKNFIDYNAHNTASSIVRTSPNNAYYFRVCSLQNPYGNNVCVNLHWDGERDGEYEAYSEHIYPLDSDLELRGIPKLNANNNLYYDGDTYESDGTVTRKYGIVDLGTLSWTLTTWGGKTNFSAYLSDAKNVAAGVLADMISIAYEEVTQNTFYVNATDGTMCLNNSILRVANSNYETASAFKTAMNGVKLQYKLATPTTETADTFENPQLVDNWGTEEYIDSREVQIPVGHITKYPPDLKAKLESAPDSPASDGDYILRHNNGENSYVALTKELPAVPTTDGTYVLKATVSSGVATLSWVAE